MKKIAILGKLETKYDAPFDNPEWEIWSMNKHNDEELIPRVDKWFDIHIEPAKKDADILRDDFPFEECKQLAGGNYFVTITSYLIAYAILQTINSEGKFEHTYFERNKKTLKLERLSTCQIKEIQSTGLKDKNGKLIYEGDIVKIKNKIFFIKYEIGSFLIIRNEQSLDAWYEMFTEAWNDDVYPLSQLYVDEYIQEECIDCIEVIGNIYEN